MEIKVKKNTETHSLTVTFGTSKLEMFLTEVNYKGDEKTYGLSSYSVNMEDIRSLLKSVIRQNMKENYL